MEDDWRDDPVGQQLIKKEDWTGITYFDPSAREDVGAGLAYGSDAGTRAKGQKDVDHGNPYRGDLPPFVLRTIRMRLSLGMLRDIGAGRLLQVLSG